MTDPDHPDFVPNGWLLALADAVEAACRADRRAEAADRLAMAQRWVAAAPTGGRQALLARCQGLLGARDPGEAFGEAMEHAAALPAFERARTGLLYGEWLRRERQRSAARTHLRAAVELFQGLAAVPWAQRAEAELRATGETPRKRDASTLTQLTAQEVQIAGLVAQGLTNRDIAAQLYLSPRTVDYHLRKVFTKLGIGSRPRSGWTAAAFTSSKACPDPGRCSRSSTEEAGPRSAAAWPHRPRSAMMSLGNLAWPVYCQLSS